VDHKVLKRFYDPFLKRHTIPGENINVPDEFYESYRPFITEKPKLEVKPISDVLPGFKFEERPKIPKKKVK